MEDFEDRMRPGTRKARVMNASHAFRRVYVYEALDAAWLDCASRLVCGQGTRFARMEVTMAADPKRAEPRVHLCVSVWITDGGKCTARAVLKHSDVADAVGRLSASTTAWPQLRTALAAVCPGAVPRFTELLAMATECFERGRPPTEAAQARAALVRCCPDVDADALAGVDLLRALWAAAGDPSTPTRSAAAAKRLLTQLASTASRGRCNVASLLE